MSSGLRHFDTEVVNVKYILQCAFRMLDGKVKCLKRAVMRSYSVLTTNAHISDAYFYYTEFGRPNYYLSQFDRILDDKALYVQCTLPVKKQRTFFALLCETGKR